MVSGVKRFLCYITRMQENLEEKQTPSSPVGVKTTMQSFWELVRFAIIALIIVVPIRVYIAQPFIVSGSSMVPTFENGQYLIVDEISYRLNDPKRNDVIIFKYPKDTTKFFIKRIIGLPNETLEIKNDVITVFNEEYKEGLKLEQPFTSSGVNGNSSFKLNKDEYFVMGDNRGASSDSRYWGALSKDLVVGRAFLRLWPINKMDVFPGNYLQAE